MRRGTTAFEQIISGPHTKSVRVQACRGNLPLGYLAASAASLSLDGDASTITRRTLDLTVAATDQAIAWLSAPSTTIKAWSVVSSGRASASMPVHWGVCPQPSINRDAGTITVSSPDLAQRVANARFVAPYASNTAMTVAQQVASLVHDALPWIVFRDETGDSTAVTGVTWTDARTDAIVQLAQSITAETFLSPSAADGSPAWVIRPERTLASLPDFTIMDGVNLSTAAESVDFTKTYNVIVASADRSDSAGLQGVSMDTDPSSPLNIMDCGQKVGRISSSLYTTQEQCEQAAYVARMRLTGYPASVDVTGIAHPGVECGDLWVVRHNRTSYRIIPSSISMDLLGASMQASGPTATLPQPEVA